MDHLVNPRPPYVFTDGPHVTGQPWWAGADGATWRATARHLLEYDLLRLYRREGFESTAHYAECELGVTPARTAELLRICKKLLDLPLVDSALFHGLVTWEQVVVLTRVAVPETEVALLRRALGLPASEPELLAERSAQRLEEGWAPPAPWDGGGQAGGALPLFGLRPEGGSAASDARVARARGSWRGHGAPNVRQPCGAPPSTS